MADKKYKLKFHLSNGTVKEVEFTAPQGPQGDPFTYEDFTQEQLAALKGPDGKSAYEYAREAGFEGSEEEFAKALFSGSGFQVGDILTTVRTDLGEKWLLCNGDKVDAEAHPDLKRVLSPVGFGDWTKKDFWSYSGASAKIKCVTYANGYWVVGGSYYTGSSYYARIAYTTDLAGDWTIKDLWSCGSNKECSVNSVDYVDGRWVVGGVYAGSPNYYARIAYTTDLAGTWTTKDLWYSRATPNSSVIYADGKWVAIGQYYDGTNYYARLAYATDLAGTWTTKDLWNGTRYEVGINCIAHGDGKWVVGGCNYADSTGYARIAYATDLAGDWTTKDLWSGISSNHNIKCITYADGYWVVGGSAYLDSTYYGEIAYTTDPAGDWTTKDLWSGTKTSSSNSVNSVVYADGSWVAAGQYCDGINHLARIAYGPDPASFGGSRDVWESSENIDGINSVVYADGSWVAIGQYYDDTNYYAQIVYCDDTVVVLPTISTGGAYNYIKALEG